MSRTPFVRRFFSAVLAFVFLSNGPVSAAEFSQTPAGNYQPEVSVQEFEARQDNTVQALPPAGDAALSFLEDSSPLKPATPAEDLAQETYDYERYDFEDALEQLRPEYASAVIVKNLETADLEKLLDLSFETAVLVLHGEIVLLTSGSEDEIGVLPAAAKLIREASFISHTHPGIYSAEGPSGQDVNEAVAAPFEEYVLTHIGAYAYNNEGAINPDTPYGYAAYLEALDRAVKADAANASQIEARKDLNTFIAEQDRYNNATEEEKETFRMGATLSYTNGLTASNTTTLPGSPYPYLMAGSYSTTTIALLSGPRFQLNYNTTATGSLSGLTVSFDNASTPAVETANLAALANLTFGIQGDATAVKVDVIDVNGKKDTFTLTNVISGTERFWRINTSTISNALDKTKIKQINFYVNQSVTTKTTRVGNVKIRTYGVNVNPPVTPAVTSQVPAATNASSLVLTGTKEANMSLWINGVQVVAANPATTWSVTRSLVEGNNAFNIQTKNALGLLSAVNAVTTLRDTVVPTGSIVSIAKADPKLGQTYRDVTLNLQAADNASGVKSMRISVLKEGSQNWTVMPEENFTASKALRLEEGWGNYQVRLEIFDNAGNKAADSFKTVHLDVSDFLADASFRFFNNMFDPDHGAIEPTHAYPREGYYQRGFTQPTNFGFEAMLLSGIIAGDIAVDAISKTQAKALLRTMIDNLVRDQNDSRIGALGLLPWMGINPQTGDWGRYNDPYGRQFMLGDNVNLSTSLGSAFGALLDASVNANDADIVFIKSKIEEFLENQRAGYACLYDASNGLMRQGFRFDNNAALDHAVTSCPSTNSDPAVTFTGGHEDLFGNEFQSGMLFTALRYGATIPESVYTKLSVATRQYTDVNGNVIPTVAPFSGAFQQLWPAMMMPEILEDAAGNPVEINPAFRRMLENYVDINLDHATRNNIPGFLSASYDRVLMNLTQSSDEIINFTFDTNQGIAYRKRDMNLLGTGFDFRSNSNQPVNEARLEFKQWQGPNLVIIWEKTFSITPGETFFHVELPDLPGMGDIDEVVLVTNGTAVQQGLQLQILDVTFPDYREYRFEAGISSIAFAGGCCDENAASLYTLGAAHMVRPQEVDLFLENIMRNYGDRLLTSHGLWEGIAKDLGANGTVIDDQVFANVASFILGMNGKGPEYMARYLQSRASDVAPGTLYDELTQLWSPDVAREVNVAQNSSSIFDFSFSGFNATSYRQATPVNTSGRKLRITYRSTQQVDNVVIEMKQQGQGAPLRTVNVTLENTGGEERTIEIDIDQAPFDFWIGYTSEINVLFAQQFGWPRDTIQSLVIF